MRGLKTASALAIASACSGTPMRRNPHEGEHQLTFHNIAGGSVCRLNVWAVAESNEGTNRLTIPELRNGDMLKMWLVPGDYQVRATGCDYEKLDVRGFVTNVRLNQNGNVVLYREDDKASKASAVQLAHDIENTYLVVAKVQFVKNPKPRTAPDTEKPPL